MGYVGGKVGYGAKGRVAGRQVTAVLLRWRWHGISARPLSGVGEWQEECPSNRAQCSPEGDAQPQPESPDSVTRPPLRCLSAYFCPLGFHSPPPSHLLETRCLFVLPPRRNVPPAPCPSMAVWR